MLRSEGAGSFSRYMRKRTDTGAGLVEISQHSKNRVNVADSSARGESFARIVLLGMGLESRMNITLSIGPLISLIAGILILAVPRLLNYIVALYLIIIGLLGIFGAGNFHFK